MSLKRHGMLACVCALTCLLIATSTIALAGDDPNACDVPNEEPDVIVGSLYQLERKGAVGDITAFSIGTISCNVGTCWLEWFAGASGRHPVIAQNMFRLQNDRFEHIGQSWLKHGFTALTGNTCSNSCIPPPNGQHLGVNCSDPYSSFLNGQQNGMGPKFEVNPVTGIHAHPITNGNSTGNAIYKRLQVHNVDLDPALNPGASYFIEGHYVAPDDSEAGNQDNNASYRPIIVSAGGGAFFAQLTGSTVREDPGIMAWAAANPSVQIFNKKSPGDGIFLLGALVTDLGGGMWHYEYALQNVSSHRSAMSFSVPVGAVSNVEFHDVDYHSGEPFELTDWTNNNAAGGVLTWTTGANEAQNPIANALRWGTLYNFRFDSPAPPTTQDVSIQLYRAGIPEAIVISDVPAPLGCNNDGTCDPGEHCDFCPDDCADAICDPDENSCGCEIDCGPPQLGEIDCSDGLDDDCDGLPDCQDPECCADAACSAPDDDSDGFIGCNDCDGTNGQVWNHPGEVTGLTIAEGGGTYTLAWDAPADMGGTSATYEALRAISPQDFISITACVESLTPTDLELDDPADPHPGFMYVYLIRAKNDCPGGDGTLGQSSDSVERVGRSCP